VAVLGVDACWERAGWGAAQLSSWHAGMRKRIIGCLALAGCAVLPLAGSGVAVASAAKATSDQVGLAGYHFSGSGISRIHVRGTFTVPTATCGSAARSYQLQIGAGFKNGSAPKGAVVIVMLQCTSGKQGIGSVQLVAGHYGIEPAAPIKAGEVLTVAATAEKSHSAARLVLPGGKSYYVRGPGGTPKGGDYALTISGSQALSFSAVRFSNCKVNGTPLAAVHPKVWESVTSSGTVDGRVSPLTGGTSFTISS
jgi:hypothetical protein